jgi:PhnB protein
MAKKTKKKSIKKVAKKAVNKTTKKTTPKKSVKKAAPQKIVKTKAKKASKPVVRKTAKKPVVKAEPKSTVINPYLTFPGNCEEAFKFYKSVFGGQFTYIGRFNEMPATDGQTVPASEAEKIMHIALPIGKDSILMGSDSSDAFGHVTVIGNNFSISINAVNDAEADRLYKGLSAGGSQTMPMSKTFWGSYFGMLTDKFGIQWMVSCEPTRK